MTHFDAAFKYTIQNEGVQDNDPTDRGGFTRYGVTEGTANQHRCLIHPSGVNVRNVDLTLAKHIYQEDYWEFDGVGNISIAVKLFDLGVNFGVKTVIKLAQETINSLGNYNIKVDGILGKVSCDILNSIDANKFLDTFETHVDDRYWMIIYNDLVRKFGKKAVDSTQAKFGKGWFRRGNRRYYTS
jgi:lysozyme family protein